ncbi:hypothetical protein LK994_07830 [Ferruginibacter lapsinanis]|uniref:hypothetical protein n=1 Tax=Ferruginibacter lapsinanis TaxID=563172 RepID=UPI001E29FFAD|nr:hypothetical protein [Ferruginibacter lapsinanis]UEG48544.1 hypothetical protein LK994_07830 [Ferruginibacter lapsinanis]
MVDNEYEKVCLITGAGAIENAWKPIIRILEPEYKFVFDIDSSNFFLSLLVYQLRTIAFDDSPNSKQHLELMLRDYHLIKSELCRSLIFAEKHKEIFIRKQFFSVLDKFIFQKHIKSVQITTNWDTVVDNAVNYYGHSTEGGIVGRLETFHLHGSVQNSKTLYLPSEITREPYRSKEESVQMLKNHSSVLNAVSECNRTILYGISLDPLDAELAQILSLGWDSINTKEIVVINPDYKKVAKRIRLLLNDEERNIKVTAYLPDDLENEVQV